MPNIAGTVLYGILGDALPDNEKFALLRQINTYDIVQTKPEYIYPVYKNVIPGFAARFNDTDEFDTIVKPNDKRKNIPSDNYYGLSDASSTSHLDEVFEEVVKYSVEPFKKISQHLDNYLKTAVLSDGEIEYVKTYKTVVDCIANVLINTQNDRNKNFENTEELEGSTSYQLMTQSLQLAINKLKNPNSKPDDVKRALSQYNKCARKYIKEHKGIIFGPRTGNGQSRLEMAKYGAGLVPGMINCYDNMRREFNPVKDETGKSYMDMTAQEIEDMPFHLEELHEQEMLSSSTIRTADNFERTFESSKKQIEVRKLISEKNKFMSSNYLITTEMIYAKMLLL